MLFSQPTSNDSVGKGGACGGRISAETWRILITGTQQSYISLNWVIWTLSFKTLYDWPQDILPQIFLYLLYCCYFFSAQMHFAQRSLLWPREVGCLTFPSSHSLPLNFSIALTIPKSFWVFVYMFISSCPTPPWGLFVSFRLYPPCLERLWREVGMFWLDESAGEVQASQLVIHSRYFQNKCNAYIFVFCHMEINGKRKWFIYLVE